MTTHWIVKHKATGAYQTLPRPTDKAAWEDFWFRIERSLTVRKVDENDYVAVEIQITETGATCDNNGW